ncbi:9766_t:CDS:2 [Acaulospora morrowiae]|uniref:9766_t:CDS:1 n=1 Tax=Acaulospora morrowiae TaxID=94023 RepID=A0A9N9A818_9GLOM|nr:9766_t:CDS:2 [Acaulospora morrowiae]
MGLLSNINLNELLSFVIVGSIGYVSYFYYKYFTRENPLPGPLPLPLIGNFYLLKDELAIMLSKLQANYGDFFEVYMGNQRYVCVGNEDLAKEMMKTSLDSKFHQRTDENNGLKELGLLHSGLIFNIDYDDWQYHRRFYSKTMLSPLFSKQAVASVQVGFDEMRKYWDQLGEDIVIDFPNWMKRYFLDTIAITTSSKPAYALANFYNNVSPNKKITVSTHYIKESEMFMNAIDSFNSALKWFNLFPAYVRNFPGINLHTRKLKNEFFWFKNDVRKVVKARRSEIDATPKDQPLTPDLLTMFLTVNTPRDVTERIADDQHDKPMTDEEAASNYMEVLSGGVDTGSNSICYIVYYISHYPDVKQKLLKEFETVIGRDPNVKITLDQLNKLEYTEAVIKEVSRIFTVTPVTFKKNTGPAEIGGIVFPSDTKFFISRQALHLSKSQWSDPDKFNPDRFLKFNPESKNPFYMFGAGPGRNLAMIELKATVFMLYSRYEVELVDMNASIKYRSSHMRHCTELKVRIKRRRDLDTVKN